MLLVYGVKNDNRLNCCFFNTLFQKKIQFSSKKNPSFSIDIFCINLCIVFKRFKKGLEMKNTKKKKLFGF